MNVKGIISYAMFHIENMRYENEKWKKEILAEWELSKKYPRKKKKLIRKDLNFRWRLANYDPLNMYNF